MIPIANAQINPPGPISGENPLGTIGNAIGFIFQLLLIVAGLYAFLQIIFAGYGMISSGGDKHALETSRSKIIWAIIGLVVVLLSWGLIIFLEKVLGICLGFSCPINFNPSTPYDPTNSYKGGL